MSEQDELKLQIGKEIPETIKAYLAGIVDGEGCIYMEFRRHKNKNGEITTRSSRINCVVTNSNPKIMAFLSEYYNGYVRITKQQAMFHWKDRLNWTVAGKQAKRFLTDILPYLLLKKEQAEIGLAVLKTSKRYGRRGRVSPSICEFRLQAKERIKELNRRGKSPSEQAEVLLEKPK